MAKILQKPIVKINFLSLLLNMIDTSLRRYQSKQGKKLQDIFHQDNMQFVLIHGLGVQVMKNIIHQVISLIKNKNTANGILGLGIICQIPLRAIF